jgi:hypothetical protein
MYVIVFAPKSYCVYIGEDVKKIKSGKEEIPGRNEKKINKQRNKQTAESV